MRKAVFSGSFYPNQKNQLKTTITTFFNNIIDQTEKPIVKGLIVPHAGYIYSGQTAAYAFKSIQNKLYEQIVILGPSHRYNFVGASLYEGEGYDTPCGEVPIQKELTRYIRNESSHHFFEPRAHEKEHSIEVECPFLRIVQPSIPIIPIIIGQFNEQIIHSLTEAITRYCNPETTLLIASTDFSHFYSAQEAEKMDQLGATLIIKKQIKKLIKKCKEEKTQLCGLGAVLVLMNILKKWGPVTYNVLDYTHSGRITGDNRSVVGYHSIQCV